MESATDVLKQGGRYASALSKWFLLHTKRAFPFRVAMHEPTEIEAEALDDVKVMRDEMRSYLVWRRSVLIFCIPSVFTSAALGIVALNTKNDYGLFEYDNFHAIGKLSIAMPYIAPSVLLVSAYLSFRSWTKLQNSSKVLSWGWLIAIVMPVWPTLIPVELLVREENYDRASGIEVGVALSIQYLIQIMPIFISIPRGVIGGAIRIRSLLPDSSLPGWVIVIVAPFLSLIMFAALMIISQVFGNILLLSGATFLVLSPSLYLVFREYLTQSTGEEDELKMIKLQKAVVLCQLLGFIFLLIWAYTYEVEPRTFTYEVDRNGIQQDLPIYQFMGFRIIGPQNEENPPLLSYESGVNLAFESIGRALLTVVVVADGVLHMVLVDWDTTRKRILDVGRTDMSEWYHLKVALSDNDDSTQEIRRTSSGRDDDVEEASAPFTASSNNHQQPYLTQLYNEAKTKVFGESGPKS